MEALWIMFKNVMVFVALAIPGYLLVKTKELTQAQSGALSKLLMYVGMPFLILTNSIKIDFNMWKKKDFGSLFKKYNRQPY